METLFDNRRMILILAALILSGLSVLPGCGGSRSDLERIEAVLDQFEIGIETGSAGLIRGLMSPSGEAEGSVTRRFRTEGIGLNGSDPGGFIEAMAEQNSNIRQTSHERTVTVVGDAASAAQNYDFSASFLLDTPIQNYQNSGSEEFSLVRVAGDWKISFWRDTTQ
jgi:hypothetical protein